MGSAVRVVSVMSAMSVSIVSSVMSSVAEPEPVGVEVFWLVPESEPI